LKKFLAITILAAVIFGGTFALADGPVSPTMQQISNIFFNLQGTKPMQGNLNMGGHNITNSTGFSNTSGAAAQAQAYTHSNQPITLKFFGTHYNNPRFSNDTTQTPYFANTAGSVRTWDTFGQHLTWKEIETANGVYNWSNLDAYVAWALTNNMEITFTLGQPPAWAVAGGLDNNPGTDYNYNTPDPAHPEYWEDFCTAIATRYKGEISSYEIWNEPPGYYLGTASQLATLTQEASTAIKAADPAAKIISASCTATTGISWLDSYFSALQSLGALSSIDIVGYHLYVYPYPPEAMIDLAQQVRGVMFKYGIGTMPLWDAETSWNGYVDAVTGVGVSDSIGAPTSPMPGKQQAGYLLRLFLSGAAAGCDRVFMYGMDQAWSAISPVNLSSPSNLTQTGKALQWLTEWMVGKRIVNYNHDKANGIFTLTAKDSNGIPSSWLWTEDAKPQTITLNTEKGTGSFTNWSGVTTFGTMSSVRVPINYAPKLVSGYNPQYAGDSFSYTPQYSPIMTQPPFDQLGSLNVAGGVTYISPGTAPITGAEMVPDPYFATPGDWTAPTGWTISGGIATALHSGTMSSLHPFPSILTTTGQEYQITLTVNSGTTGVYVLLYSASGSTFSTYYYSPGTYVWDIVSPRTQYIDIQTAGSSPNVSVSYFSVKPISYSAVSLTQSAGLTYDPVGQIFYAPNISTGAMHGNADTVTGLSVTSGKTLIALNSITLQGTDGTTFTFPMTSKTIMANDFSNATYTPPNLVATVDLTAQSADIGATTFYTAPADGFYLLMISGEVTQAATSSSTLQGPVVTYYDKDTNTLEYAGPGNSTANTVGTIVKNTYPIYVKSGTILQYYVNAYASSGVTPMQFAAHIRLQWVSN
jgi:Glycosyl hydrolase family 10